MTDGSNASRTEEELFDSPSEASRWWRIVSALVGTSLWAQLFWSPIATEWRSETPGLWFVGAYLLPLAIVVLTSVVRSPVLSLFGVPASLLPGLIALPSRDLALLQQPFEMVALGTTVVLYLLASSLRYSGLEELARAFERDQTRDRLDGTYRGYVAVRAAFLSVLFGLVTWASLIDPEIAGLVSQHHGSGAVSARLFIAVALFFVWCIVAYTMFLVPLSNLEYDLRALQRRLQSWRENRSGLYGRLLLWMGLAALGITGLAAIGVPIV